MQSVKMYACIGKRPVRKSQLKDSRVPFDLENDYCNPGSPTTALVYPTITYYNISTSMFSGDRPFTPCIHTTTIRVLS